jgi:adenine-specific DNA-methyltransferase
MPTLQFKGKNIIWNHHLAVPFHTLDEVPELHYKPEKANGNMIIEGDNLIVLKALLPQFSGRINVIYIDPPYNTGNEGWIYNDSVNSPLLKDWIGKQIGLEDLTRHDKWLCMIVPRIKILRDLLAEDGVIFISIDDNEQHRLRGILDEIFGEQNFIQNIIWQKKFSPQNDATYFSDNHDFLICYAKNKIEGEQTIGWQRNLIPRNVEQDTRYSNPDNDPRGVWISSDMTVKTYSEEYDYEITTPSGKKIKPTRGRCWFTSKESFQKLVQDKRVWFGENGTNVPRIKKFLSEVQNGIVPISIWLHTEVGHNQQAKQELKQLFSEVDLPFDTPKPVSLIKRVLQLSTDKNSIILDSFAGSGTTMHAVMDINKEDGGKRKCILVQMPENSEADPDKNICKDIARERVKRAIDKYSYDSGFKYYRLGIPLDAETMLEGQLPTYNQFAKYVYYLCTGENLDAEDKINEAEFYVGEFGKQAIYLAYKQDYETLTHLALNLTLAEKIKEQQPGKKRIVYAPSCFLDEDYLTDNQFEYVGIPYNLFQRK